MRILHLTDLHLPRLPGPIQDGVDARAVLHGLLHDLRRVTDIDLVVVSGDIADDGSPEGYADARSIVGGFAREVGARRVVWCTGNHDDRDSFADTLGSGHLDVSGKDIGQLMSSPRRERAAVSDLDGFRLITLDSLIPGQVAGCLSEEQLVWVQEVLTGSAANGSVVILHHPPISVSEPWAAASLQEPATLARAIQGTDVCAVLCGHVHAQVTGFLSGVPVWVGPGVVTRIDLTASPDLVRAVRGAAATVIDLGGPHDPRFHILHARDLRAGEHVYLVDSTTWQYVDFE